MEAMLNPRGDLPHSTFQPSSYFSRSESTLSALRHRRLSSYPIPIKKSKKSQCHDWIFSTASNTHVAIDRASFKTYVSFKSYVLTVSDQRRIAVHGIGSVEIKIRRAAGSKESHTIRLENVLHVPDWLCNIFSDVYFSLDQEYEHTWTQFGVNFFMQEGVHFRPWGYTENFCGLDRLVLSKHLQGRSPMLEDPDREIFSISLNFPQSQKNKWGDLVATEMKKEATRYEKYLSKQKDSPDNGSKKELLLPKNGTTNTIPVDAKRKEDMANTSTDGIKWKLMPDISILSAHMRNQSVNSVNEFEGGLDFLKRVSSLNFGMQRGVITG
ncbi:hypothetical protein LTR84_011083 [Exophiala bonariae]|uniref:Retrovirus-related Pol polyprotein from transposon TNT 1-94-like beta-barrel domain-containing protein n=1 Tax=Exophiala bonariae TaxID=1690606 RepID=A0AAV9NLW3_9EURO|nr:hypothetical protein LTR84_011083 [Exophiala bonariae]